MTVSGVTVGKDGIVTAEKDEGDSEVVERDAKAKGEKSAAIGGGRKRKVGKVVGGDVEEEEEEGRAEAAATRNETPNAKKDDKNKALPKGKKKAKKIKLSFGDDDGD